MLSLPAGDCAFRTRLRAKFLHTSSQADVARRGATHPLPGKQGTLREVMKRSSLNEGSTEIRVQHGVCKALPLLSFPQPQKQSKKKIQAMLGLQISQCKGLVWPQGNSTRHAMHGYHALMRHRGHQGAQKLAPILLHHLCEKKPCKAIDAEHQGDQSSSLQTLPFVS